MYNLLMELLKKTWHHVSNDNIKVKKIVSKEKISYEYASYQRNTNSVVIWYKFDETITKIFIIFNLRARII